MLTMECEGVFMPDILKQQVYSANMLLCKHNLVIFTWGNVSGIDRNKGLIVIKPSGVKYSELKVEDMVVLDMDGNIIEGELNPSSDTDTHLYLYRSFNNIGSIVHTHSTYATARAQSGLSLPPFGTTHSDYYYGTIPCTRKLTENETASQYELNTGKVIVEAFDNIDPGFCPGVFVNGHGPFTWGKDASDAVHNAVVLEEISKIAFLSQTLNSNISTLDQHLQDKHFYRKHGQSATYGQK